MYNIYINVIIDIYSVGSNLIQAIITQLCDGQRIQFQKEGKRKQKWLYKQAG